MLLFGYGRPKQYFLQREIEGQQVYTENIDFGCRFFPDSMERAPLPISVPVVKGSDEYRIFVLGESAALGFPDLSSSFARILEVMLRERYPDTRFTIANTAMTAINSHVIRPIARDCTALQPDLFIVYMGNNEVVGPYGPANVLGAYAPQLRLARASIWAKSTRTGELLSHITSAATRSSAAPQGWQGMGVFENSKIRADDPRLAVVYANFAANLRDICHVGQAAGAEVLVCTVATNLQDSPPFGSLPSAELTAAQAADWQRQFEAGIDHETKQEYLGAIEQYQRAAQIDGGRADLHFRWARCLLAVDRVSEAREHFTLARDFDVLRFRTDTKINELIQSLATETDEGGVHLVDIAHTLEQTNESKSTEEKLFHEHVHLTFAGNYLIARNLFEQICELLPARLRQSGTAEAEPVAEAVCKDRLVYGDWKRFLELTDLNQLYGQPPFVDQLFSDERKQHHQAELSQLEQRLEAGGMDETASRYRRILEQNSREVLMRQDLAVLLMSQRKLEEALEEIAKLQRRLPYHPVPRVMFAQVLMEQGEHYEALRECDAALRLRPGWPQAVQVREQVEAALGRSR